MTNTAKPGLSPAVRALAEADFSAVVDAFANAGFSVTTPAPGILTLRAAVSEASRPAVLLSVGVHGDETGPIEVVATLIDALARTPEALAVNLMLCVGNIDAIAAGKRFIDADLNRMFRLDRGSLADAAEAARADVMIAATDAFFDAAGPQRWHLDLHTAIRASHYPMFAIVPELIPAEDSQRLFAWLGQAAIGAIIMNPQSAGTYSYYSAEHHAALGTTIELGRVGTLGQNDLSQFTDAAAALDALLRGSHCAVKSDPHVFKVAQNIIKHSAAFTMGFSSTTPNFAVLKRGDVIATDGATVYTVQHDEEFVVFPNPDVRIGLRAGLMVVRVN